MPPASTTQILTLNTTLARSAPPLLISQALLTRQVLPPRRLLKFHPHLQVSCLRRRLTPPYALATNSGASATTYSGHNTRTQRSSLTNLPSASHTPGISFEIPSRTPVSPSISHRPTPSPVPQAPGTGIVDTGMVPTERPLFLLRWGAYPAGPGAFPTESLEDEAKIVVQEREMIAQQQGAQQCAFSSN
ncbi:hypothetical protein F4604DRAFT_1927941 [Suillus subluteus]|nr:hypothetical protein F4604DRAFT_1927941 [Suillus subluteus]